MPVLMRPDGAVQVGWDPRRAVLVRPPDGLSTAALAELLRVMQSGIATPDLRRWRATAGSSTRTPVADLVASLLERGRGDGRRHPRQTRSASIRIHGRGPLSDLLAGALRCSGPRVQAQQPQPRRRRGRSTTDLVVLSDFLVTDPRVRAGPARRAGAAPAGPGARRHRTGRARWSSPGVTSCLRLRRPAPQRPRRRVARGRRAVARTPSAAPTGPTMLATAALALNQVDRVIRAVPRRGDAVGHRRATADPGHHAGVRRSTPDRRSAGAGRGIRAATADKRLLPHVRCGAFEHRHG